MLYPRLKPQRVDVVENSDLGLMLHKHFRPCYPIQTFFAHDRIDSSDRDIEVRLTSVLRLFVRYLRIKP